MEGPVTKHNKNRCPSSSHSATTHSSVSHTQRDDSAEACGSQLQGRSPWSPTPWCSHLWVVPAHAVSGWVCMSTFCNVAEVWHATSNATRPCSFLFALSLITQPGGSQSLCYEDNFEAHREVHARRNWSLQPRAMWLNRLGSGSRRPERLRPCPWEARGWNHRLSHFWAPGPQ